MNVASRPPCSFFCLFPIRVSLRLLPAAELRAALIDFFFTRPFTLFPMLQSQFDEYVKNKWVCLCCAFLFRRVACSAKVFVGVGRSHDQTGLIRLWARISGLSKCTSTLHLHALHSCCDSSSYVTPLSCGGEDRKVNHKQSIRPTFSTWRTSRSRRLSFDINYYHCFYLYFPLLYSVALPTFALSQSLRKWSQFYPISRHSWWWLPHRRLRRWHRNHSDRWRSRRFQRAVTTRPLHFSINANP